MKLVSQVLIIYKGFSTGYVTTEKNSVRNNPKNDEEFNAQRGFY
jgi:hypothetical protein